MFTSDYDTQMPSKITKKRGTEISNVIHQQNLAIKDDKEFKVRKFYKQEVLIPTHGGHPLKTEIWTTDEKPNLKRRKPSEVEKFICEVCNKEFEERRRLLIHARCHKKKEDEVQRIEKTSLKTENGDLNSARMEDTLPDTFEFVNSQEAKDDEKKVILKENFDNENDVYEITQSEKNNIKTENDDEKLQNHASNNDNAINCITNGTDVSGSIEHKNIDERNSFDFENIDLNSSTYDITPTQEIDETEQSKSKNEPDQK